MGIFSQRRDRCLCAFCGADHRVYMKAHISAFDVAICALAGLLVVAPFAGEFDARGLGLGAIFVGIAEVFVGLRHRMSVKCGRCGFDPIIYRKSQERAAEIVRLHLERRAQNPAHLLAEPIIAAGRRAGRDAARGRSNRASRKSDPTQQP